MRDDLRSSAPAGGRRWLGVGMVPCDCTYVYVDVGLTLPRLLLPQVCLRCNGARQIVAAGWSELD